MDDFDNEVEHPKKRRRRSAQKPVSAHLRFDENLREDVAVLSADLWSELVSGSSSCILRQISKLTRPEHSGDTQQPQPTKFYIAISPWAPAATSIEEVPWTIVPAVQRPAIQGQETPQASSPTIQLPPSSITCQSFLRHFSVSDAGRHGSLIPKQIEIRVLQVRPLELETVYVTIDKDLLDKVDDIQSRFGGGFQTGRPSSQDKNKALSNGDIKKSPADAEERLRALVRAGLGKLSVVHSQDIFALPLPAHPITHVPAPPAIVAACEPVTQGHMSSNTKIILVQEGAAQEKALKELQPAPVMGDILEDTEDTSNEAFYSAAEDKQTTTSSEYDDDLDGESSEDSSQEHSSDDDSDDSMEDMISLAAPGLPPQQSGTLSAMTAATPRPGMRKPSGIQTPGSVYSAFTSTTARAGARPGKLFRTEALLQRIPVETLHPKPSHEDDDESFIYVDTSALGKLGCFSGDWVRIEVSKYARSGLASLTLGLGADSEQESDWRAVRIFGISGLPNRKPRYAVDKSGERRSSFSQSTSMAGLTPSVYVPPSLLGNLQNSQYVKIGVLPKPPTMSMMRSSHLPQKAAMAQEPPQAREVSLSKVSTPLSTTPDLQPALFAGLKRYFEAKRRILKRGDLIAISVDTELSKITYSAVSAEESSDELLTRLSAMQSRKRSTSALAFFCVDHLVAELAASADEFSHEARWGGIATIDISSVRMATDGRTLQAVSNSTQMYLEYWLDQKTMPRSPLATSPLVSAADLPSAEPLSLEKRLRDLVAVATSPRAISLGLPPLVILLHSNQRQIGKTYTAMSACSGAGIHTFTISSQDLLSENASTSGGGDYKTEDTLKHRAERALDSGARNTALLIQHIEALTADRMVPALQSIIADSRVLIATTTDIDKIPDGIRSLFSHEFEILAPTEDERAVILQNACLEQCLSLDTSVDLKSVALKTAALVAGDLVDVVSRASLARSARLRALADSQDVTLSDITVSGGTFSISILAADFTTAISHARANFSDSIGAPKIPTVTWDDIGGLADQKSSIMETISLPLSRPELFANGMRKRSGILFYGPPGTGKTLLAKAIATEFSLNFFSVKGPELLNMYIGESEANVRRVFQRARDARPCVVFFDELDSVAPARGKQGDSGGVMDRIVSQLLAELDGMSSAPSGDDDSGSNAGGVFVIGATNRPDLLDPALLRPGRFDKMLYLGVAANHDQQVTIMEALTRKFTLAPDVDLKRVASKLPFTYTGADLYALCSDAMLKAITRKTGLVDQKVAEISKMRGESITTAYFFDHLATPEDIAVMVSEEDFLAAQREMVASVSAKELEHFERIRLQFEEQDISNTDSKKAEPKPSLPLRQPLMRENTAIHDKPPAGPPTLTRRADIEARKLSNAPGKGKGKSKGIANPDSGPESVDDSHFDADVSEPFYQHMNGSVNGTKGKGKGKGAISRAKAMDGFVDDEDADEDLYT
jgi:peroxin-6